MSKIIGAHIPFEPKNYLLNGNFDVWQRIGSAQLLTSTNAAYGADRWKLVPSVTSASSAQMIQTSSSNTGSIYDCIVGAWSVNQKSAALQILENNTSVILRGRTVTFSVYGKSGQASPIRLEVLSWTGTADSLTAMSNVVPYTEWSGFTPATNFSSLGSAAFTSTTAVYQRVSVTVVVPSSCNNLVCVFVSNDTGGNQNYLSQAMLNEGATPLTFQTAGKNIQQELAMCQRFYQKSFPYSVAPGHNVDQSCLRSESSSSTEPYFSFLRPVIMFKNPTTTLYTPGSNTAGQWTNMSNTTIGSANARLLMNQAQALIIDNTGTNLAGVYGIHFTSDAEI